MKKRVVLAVVFLWTTLSLPVAIAQKNEARDFPPDFHPYIRSVIPEDFAPGAASAEYQPEGSEEFRDCTLAETHGSPPLVN